jgi:hypothetical protein
MSPKLPSEQDDNSLAGRAPQRAAPSPRGAQPGDAPASPTSGQDSPPDLNREEGKDGSRETLGPDGFLASENQSAQQSESPAGLITNRPPSKTNTGGEDWFEVSLYIRHRNFHKLAAQLDAARKAAENNDHGGDVVKFGGMTFLVRPCGANAGDGKKFVHFRWQLQCENGLIIQLMRREHPHQTMPNGNVRATSLLLMQIGAKAVWQLAKKLLRAMGCIIERNKLSRVDPCVDMPEMSIQTLCAAHSAGHRVTRARASEAYHSEDHIVCTDSSEHSFGRKPTGFVVGKSPLKVRVYDKFRESNHVLEKITAVVSYRWGYWTTKAVRVEFSIRRERLKKFGVDTVEHWFAKRAAICEELCTKCFRLTNGPVDPDHADRSETLPEWLLVQAAFAEWTGKPDYINLKPLPVQNVPAMNLLLQIIGLGKSYLAKTGSKIDSNEMFIDEVMRDVLTLIELEDMPAEVWRRVVELGLAPTDLKQLEDDDL